jgi:RNA recognition motif-containing protein
MNIYVRNLSFQAGYDDLLKIFEAYGEVTSAKIIVDRMSGRSRGYGFIEMPDDGAAQKAIDELNGKEIGGRALTVNMARPKENRPPRDRNRS